MLRHRRQAFAPYVRRLLIHFLINHRMIREDNEEGYHEICERIKQRLGRVALAVEVGKVEI
jgi:hypothetical protein